MVTLWSAKPTCRGSIPLYASMLRKMRGNARVAELVYAHDLKSCLARGVGSMPTPGTRRGGEIGRRAALRTQWGNPLEVRVLSSAQDSIIYLFFDTIDIMSDSPTPERDLKAPNGKNLIIGGAILFALGVVVYVLTSGYGFSWSYPLVGISWICLIIGSIRIWKTNSVSIRFKSFSLILVILVSYILISYFYEVSGPSSPSGNVLI